MSIPTYSFPLTLDHLYSLLYPLLLTDLLFHLSRRASKSVATLQATTLMVTSVLFSLGCLELLYLIHSPIFYLLLTCLSLVTVTLAIPVRDSVVSNYSGICLLLTYLFYKQQRPPYPGYIDPVLVIDMVIAQILIAHLPTLY